MVDFKKRILKGLLEQLRSKLEVLQASAQAAHEAATNTESKAENKYDTRGLEASYLAGAQSKRAAETAGYIRLCESISLDSHPAGDQINWSSLIKLKIDDEDEQTVFMLPIPGGLSVELDGTKITAISLDAPMGKKLKGKKTGDYFELTVEKNRKEYEIISIH